MWRDYRLHFDKRKTRKTKNKKMKKHGTFCLLIGLLLLIFSSCEKMVEVDPPQSQISSANVFEDELTAVAAISRLYTRIASDGFLNITYLASLSADELMIDANDAALQFYHNELLSTNPTIETSWRYHYTTIYNANSIIEGLEKSVKLTAALKNQLTGEAKFIRALCHFYLVNLFGDVPYITSTDYRINGLVFRMPVIQVYEKIVADLTDAKNLLSLDYSYSNNERVRANKWAASALLSRVYLYTGNWLNAELFATDIIDRTALYGLITNLTDVFLKNSREAIWQLIPPYPQKYTVEGAWLNKPFFSVGNATITNNLFNAFEANDKRKINWVATGNVGTQTWYYSTKYKENLNNATGTEYTMVLRLAEQYLIRAEARAKQNKLTGPSSAASDINMIRNRAGLPNTTATTQSVLLTAIEQERRVELFAEWGHRWLDLKRTGRANAVLGAIKTGWTVTDMLYPIPFSELQLNPNIIQNPGY